jgi:uncharacterized repeat protein (TIGR03803 family)
MSRSSRWTSILFVLWMILLTAGAAIPLAAQVTTLHTFDGTDGSNVQAALVLTSSRDFYGVTGNGGASGVGTVFNMTPTGVLTTVHSFDGTDGSDPLGALIQASDGYLYGTTFEGGANGYGTVFRVSLTGVLITLHSFTYSDGANPYGGLVQGSDGNFYGTTVFGGADGYGVIFKITSGGAFAVLHTFTGSSTDGAYPYPAMIQANDGNFYGTTFSGGGAFEGTVFKMTPAGAVTLVHAFCLAGVPCPDGGNVQAGVIQASDGNLYGTVVRGGDPDCSLGGYDGCGTIFEVSLSGTFTTLRVFHTLDGGDPVSSLVETEAGVLYGVTPYGGTSSECTSGCGTVFKILPGGGSFTSVYSFCVVSGCPDGSSPVASLVEGAKGQLYGSTALGGAEGDGTIYFLP